ncbi:MAG: acetate/propionate family kinase [Alphaproteobacteria bacterium]
MVDPILALNAGSSSIKFALYRLAASDRIDLAARGAVEGIGTAPHFTARDAAGAALADKRWPDGAPADHEAVLGDLLGWIDRQLGADRLLATGHRVVHGGSDFTAPIRLTADIIEALDRLTPLAPLHQPHSLSPIRAVLALRPGLPQIACFDTAFHRTMPPVAARFALPREYEQQGVRRYGFHGLSYEYIARRLREVAPGLTAGRIIVAHLGNGASLCAMRDGCSIDTTMSFTALDGLVMGTRSGALDPGVVLYMLRQRGLSPDEVEDILYRRSGLLGVSGVSGDMRALLASPDSRAREAIELFVFRIAQQTAALAASLGGIDGFVFTAGIGERAASIRAMVAERLGWLGIEIDPVANEAANGFHADRISTAQSRVELRVIATDEEAMIARHTLDTLGRDSG